MPVAQEITETYYQPNAEYGVERLFRELAERWRRDTALLSDPVRMAMDTSYQQIIGLGPQVIPMILRDLKSEPDHWFWALSAITREDPILDSHRGNIALMAADWLEWAGRHGYAY